MESTYSIRNAASVKDLADDCMSKHAIPKKRPKSVQNDQAMLDRFIVPKIGKLKVAEIRYQDIQSIRNSLDKTPYQANRVLSLLSKMFELSVRWGWRTENPARDVEKFHEVKRHGGFRTVSCQS